MIELHSQMFRTLADVRFFVLISSCLHRSEGVCPERRIFFLCALWRGVGRRSDVCASVRACVRASGRVWGLKTNKTR